MRVFESLADLHGAVGEHIGHSDWHVVSQEQVTAFADATGDHQWIHVDPARAAAGPFGTTVAHGYLTLSLIPMLASEVYRVGGVRMGVNYGLNRVRFPAPVPVGRRIRARTVLLGAEEVAGGAAVQITWGYTVEVEGGQRPAMVAEALTRIYF